MDYYVLSYIIVSGSITIMSYACMGRTLCSVRPPFDIDEGNVSMQQVSGIDVYNCLLLWDRNKG